MGMGGVDVGEDDGAGDASRADTSDGTELGQERESTMHEARKTNSVISPSRRSQRVATYKTQNTAKHGKAVPNVSTAPSPIIPMHHSTPANTAFEPNTALISGRHPVMPTRQQRPSMEDLAR